MQFDIENDQTVSGALNYCQLIDSIYLSLNNFSSQQT